MSHNDSNFYKPFVFVLGALIIFTVFIMFVANAWSPDSPDDPLAIAAMKKSIQPVGQSRVDEVAKPADAAADESADGSADVSASAADEEPETTETQEAESTAQVMEAEEPAETAVAESAAEETQPAADTAMAAAGTVAMAGDEISLKVKAAVATNCAGCHNAGLHGAAKTDDSEAWAALSEKGLDALTASVINGKGKMPARAESSLSDEEIGQAVQLMAFNATGSGVMAAGTTAAATTKVAATDESATTESMTESADAEVASTEIPAEVKQVVDSTCTACHLVGVGDSPKLGDKDAWGKRLDAKGIDGLTASSIAGIGLMPPRGGSSLSDEQMRLAVEYIMSK